MEETMNTRIVAVSLIATLIASTLVGCAPRTPPPAHPMVNFAVEGSSRSDRTIERPSRGEAQLARMTPHRSR
jgi:hypothetical protein